VKRQIRIKVISLVRLCRKSDTEQVMLRLVIVDNHILDIIITRKMICLHEVEQKSDSLLIGFCVSVLFHSDFSYWSRAADWVGQLSGQLLFYAR